MRSQTDPRFLYTVIEVREGQEVLSEPGFVRRQWVEARQWAWSCFEVRKAVDTDSVRIRNALGELLYEIDSDCNEYGPCACCGRHTIYIEQYRDDDGQYYCADCVEQAEIAEAEHRAYGEPY